MKSGIEKFKDGTVLLDVSANATGPFATQGRDTGKDDQGVSWTSVNDTPQIPIPLTNAGDSWKIDVTQNFTDTAVWKFVDANGNTTILPLAQITWAVEYSGTLTMAANGNLTFTPDDKNKITVGTAVKGDTPPTVLTPPSANDSNGNWQ